jgi:crotonobetainyl-CoA:carnitine CoA-transferase CaiB-like acyl-CoA transferase
MGNPMVFAQAQAVSPSFPPSLGENTVEVLRDLLGLPAGEIAELGRAGVVVAQAAADNGPRR